MARRRTARSSRCVEDAEFLAEAADASAAGTLGRDDLGRLDGRGSRPRTGRKGRALFHPLRLALTGRESGPELAALLPLIGRAER